MATGKKPVIRNAYPVTRLKAYKSIVPVLYCMGDKSGRTVSASRSVLLVPLPFLAHLSRYLLHRTITTKYLTCPPLVAIGCRV